MSNIKRTTREHIKDYLYNYRWLEEELIMLNKESKITERIVNLYNKECPKQDKIKMSYKKNGDIMLEI